jgi:hypothetical protein
VLHGVGDVEVVFTAKRHSSYCQCLKQKIEEQLFFNIMHHVFQLKGGHGAPSPSGELLWAICLASILTECRLFP